MVRIILLFVPKSFVYIARLEQTVTLKSFIIDLS